MAIFRIFKIAAVRHLGFVLHGFGPSTKRSWWSLSQCKIWLESALWFWRYAISIFCALDLKMHIHAPFGGVLEVKMGKRKLLQFYPSRNAITWDWHPVNQTVSKSLFWFTPAKFLVTKRKQKTKTTRESIISSICRDAPLGLSLWILARKVTSPT